MNKLLVGSVILSAAILTGCSKVPAGYQGIIVNLYGSEKGVSERSVGVGRYWVGINEELYKFPTFLQNYTWTKGHEINKDESITMQTQDGLTINADVGITYQIRPENVALVFQRYRRGVEEITDTFLRNMVRDCMNSTASQMTVEQIYGPQKEVFMKRVNESVKQQAKEDGIDVDRIYLIGTFRLPDAVVSSIDAKIQATQNAIKVQNEVATATAEAQKKMIQAKAEADANAIVNKSLTAEFLQYQAIQKWDGKLPQVTGNATPFINIKGANQ